MRSAPRTARRQGQPLIMLGAVLGGWVAMRAMLVAAPTAAPAGTFAEPVAGTATRAVTSSPSRMGQGPIAISPVKAPIREAAAAAFLHDAVPLPLARSLAPPVVAPRVAATRLPAPARDLPPFPTAHTMLWMAAMNAVPIDAATRRALQAYHPQGSHDSSSPAAPADAGPLAPPRSLAPRGSRWHGEGWAFFRPHGLALAGTSFVGPAYGGSQVGGVVRFDLARGGVANPQLHARAASALGAGTASREVALGASIKPLRAVPLRAFAEARVIQSGVAAQIRPAAFIAGSLESDVPALGPGVRIRGYGAGGAVLGTTAFADGHAALERAVGASSEAPLAAGVGAWGGVQKGAGRIDIGPTASLRIHFGEITGRLSADYRLRVAGNASPASGAALTLSAGF